MVSSPRTAAAGGRADTGPGRPAPMISARGLARSFRTRGAVVEAVRGVDLTVAGARSSASSARTARARPPPCACSPRCSRPTAGTATVAGRDLRTDPAGVRRRIGYVAQGGGTDPACTVGRGARPAGAAVRPAHGRGPHPRRDLLRRLDLTGLERPPGPDRCPAASGGGSTSPLGLVHRPGAGLPGRADHRPGPAEPGQPLGPRPAPARRARHDRLPDHALPGRGRRALRPAPHHRPRPDRRRGHAGRAEAAGRRRRGHGGRCRRRDRAAARAALAGAPGLADPGGGRAASTCGSPSSRASGPWSELMRALDGAGRRARLDRGSPGRPSTTSSSP